MTSNLSITSIKPTSGLFATKNFKTKEGEDKKPIPVRKETVVAYVNGLTVDEQAGILEA